MSYYLVRKEKLQNFIPNMISFIFLKKHIGRKYNKIFTAAGFGADYGYFGLYFALYFPIS